MDPRRQLVELASQFDKDLRLAWATELALLGHYLRAEHVLLELGERCWDHRHLDLMAKMAMRRRRYAEAAGYWRRAVDASISGAKFEQLREAAEALERRRQEFRRRVSPATWLRFARDHGLAFLRWSRGHAIAFGAWARSRSFSKDGRKSDRRDGATPEKGSGPSER